MSMKKTIKQTLTQVYIYFLSQSLNIIILSCLSLLNISLILLYCNYYIFVIVFYYYYYVFAIKDVNIYKTLYKKKN